MNKPVNVEYVKDLIFMRQQMENVIDREIENTLRGRENQSGVYEALVYRAGLLKMRYLDSNENEKDCGE